jgi:hypothetical protein
MQNNEELKLIAKKVIVKAGIPEDEKYGSIIIILSVISIILTLVRILQECNKTKLKQVSLAEDKYALYGASIKELSNRRGWFTKMRIKKLLRKELSPEQYSKYSFSLLNALLETGESLKDDEIVTLVENANV